MPATATKNKASNKANPVLPTPSNPKNIPSSFTAYALVKSPMTGDLYQKIKLSIKDGRIESAELGNHNMRMLVADQIMSEILR